MIDVEPARPEDSAALAQFAATSFTETFGHIYAPADLATFLATWNTTAQLRAQLAQSDWQIALVRDAENAIAGFAKLGPIDFDLPAGQTADGATELHQLYVAERAKGTGIAAALMDWAIAQARTRARILYLSVFSENPRAQAFYRRYGFVDVGRNAFRVGDHIDEDRIWRLDL